MEHEHQVEASSRFLRRPVPLPASEEEYAECLVKEMEKYNSEGISKKRVGPVVSMRQTPEKYEKVIDFFHCKTARERLFCSLAVLTISATGISSYWRYFLLLFIFILHFLLLEFQFWLI